ncbi:LysR family transcriptional regulator [Marinobacterium nitratireducens]|uniref:LysR family transcriptional regulator n=1 Tax=Marinobacterium nitratireducens TaxID=518897 RepID=A0A917ZJT1_9GAMM|nr:LysR family transcriptional regulator [Marinobacterium nitratireducens]GGO84202.1 LysR family transcriptional regulator [Marinobacterium nitratireducens]
MTARHHSLPNIADFDLRLLRVFHAVVHNKGFAAAQDELGVSQSTISIQIGQLEDRLGMRLCERGRKGFHLTDEGQIVFEASQSLFRAVENFRGTIGSTRGQLIGEVHFGIVDAIASNQSINLHRGIGEFARLAPEVKLHIDVSSPQELLQGLMEEHYHVILSPMSRLHSSVHFIPTFREQQVLFCGADHPFFSMKGEEIDASLIAQSAYAGRTYMRDWQPPQDLELNHRATASHMESIALMILSGSYLGYLPSHFAENWVQSGLMRPLLQERLAYDEQFYLAHRKSERNRAAQAFAQCLQQQMEPEA